MTHNGVEVYENQSGLIGVLLSPGQGAGWSTWNDRRIAYDKRIVEKFIKDEELFNLKERRAELVKFMESIGYKRTYLDGANTLSLTFVERGVPFMIRVRYGDESIVMPDELDMITF